MRALYADPLGLRERRAPTVRRDGKNLVQSIVMNTLRTVNETENQDPRAEPVRAVYSETPLKSQRPDLTMGKNSLTKNR